MKHLSGERFGKLVAIKRGTPKGKKATWLCICDCGNTTEVITSYLTGGNTKSCGCGSSRNTIGERTRTHGMHNDSIYGVWCAMKRRCYNKNTKDYPNYGKRGIRVCDKWLSFEGFLEDMEPTYEIGLMLDRTDNDGDYEPNNCKWVTREEQNNNKRNVKIYTVFGQTGSLAQLARHFGIKYETLRYRIKSGWSIEKAVT